MPDESVRDWDGNPDSDLLRAIQKWDEIVPFDAADARFLTYVNLRHQLMLAATLLGGRLGLECTGVHEGGGAYNHNGDTCPIHEWLVESDSNAYEEAK